jgi:hypothetical protein
LKPSFRRWTIMDYSKAYSSGEITPCMVHHFLAISFMKCSFPFLFEVSNVSAVTCAYI